MLCSRILFRRFHNSNLFSNPDVIPIPTRSVASFEYAIKSGQNFLDGRRVKPLNREKNSNNEFENIEPSSGKVIGYIQSSGNEEVGRSVESAKDAFESWSQFSDTDRGRILSRASKMIRKKQNEIARIETLDTGRTFWETCADAEAAADCLEYYSGLTQILHGSHIQLPRGSFAYTRKEPLGVCAGIGAWNFPFLNIAWKVTPALCCGNTAVYKPSPLAPLTSPVFAEILTEAGLPAGVLNIVQGGAETGKLLTEHDDVAKVSFTGGKQTATKVMASCALGVKRVTLELGGKSPLVIFADADIENAVKGALMANYLTQGEVCSNAARVYVEESIYDQFLEMIVNKTKTLRVGDPMDARTEIGAVISEDHLQKVLNFIDGAEREGASILCGGKRIEMEDSNISGGYYISPCVMANCNDDMTIVREEHFGPVMSVMKFNSEEEVLKRCNNTPFGLAGGVFTSDITRAHRFVAKLQAGMCYINNYNIYPVQIPFGGYKQSGFGRENGLAVLENYTQLKTVYVEANEVDCAWPVA